MSLSQGIVLYIALLYHIFRGNTLKIFTFFQKNAIIRGGNDKHPFSEAIVVPKTLVLQFSYHESDKGWYYISETPEIVPRTCKGWY